MCKRRHWACVLGGFISAAICLVGRQIIFGFPDVTWENVAATVANRLLLGLAVGISCWRISHLVHGAVLRLIFSLSVSIGFLPAELLPFFLYPAAGTFYGLLIEWLSTDVLKAPMNSA